MPINFHAVRYPGSTNEADVGEFLDDIAGSVENYVASVGLTGDAVVNWSTINNKPTTFPPTAHQHLASDITNFSTAVAALTTKLVPDPSNAGLYIIQ